MTRKMNALAIFMLSLGTVFGSPVDLPVDTSGGMIAADQSSKVPPPIGGDPYYVLYATDTPDQVNFTNHVNRPSFEVTWEHSGSFEAGKGWPKGNGRNITYNAVYEPRGNSMIGVKGWTKVSRSRALSTIRRSWLNGLLESSD